MKRKIILSILIIATLSFAAYFLIDLFAGLLTLFATSSIIALLLFLGDLFATSDVDKWYFEKRGFWCRLGSHNWHYNSVGTPISGKHRRKCQDCPKLQYMDGNTGKWVNNNYTTL